MANSHRTVNECTLSSRKHDRFHPHTRTSAHNADWVTSTTQTNVVPNSRDLNGPSWPLGITLKEETRQALLRELGLKDRGSNYRRSSQALLRHLQKKGSRMLCLSSSTNKETLQGLRNISSPNCVGGHRHRGHLQRRCCSGSSARRATFASLQPMPCLSSFRQALQQNR